MYGIQGKTLEATVVKCNNLKETAFLTRQDPYVCLEYGSHRYRTRTCTDGDRNPVFQEKFMFTVYEGLRELTVSVYSSNLLRVDAFIGKGRVDLHRVFSQGYDDSAWPIFRNSGRSAGDVCLMLHCPNIVVRYITNHQASPSYPPSAAPPYVQPVVYYCPSPIPPAALYQPPAYNSYWPQQPGYNGSAYAYPPPSPIPYGQYGRSTGMYPPPPY